MVSTASIICMALCALIGILVPLALCWWLVKRYKVRPLTILIGAGVFIVFALGLESVVHQIVLKGPNGPTILGNIWYYALYGGLMAGLFEETGRFLAMKFLLKKEPSRPLTGVAYGAGHGGAEMLMLFGLGMISNVAMAAMINTGQTETLLATVPPEAMAQAQTQIDGIMSMGVDSCLFGLWERFSAVILQLALSVLVWLAVRRGGKWLWLFPAAILIHALVDACAVIISKTAGLLATEAILFSLAVAVASGTWMLARKKQEAVSE